MPPSNDPLLLSPWLLLLAAVPVLLLGEALTRQVRLLSQFNIPAPVVGGLLVALVVLLGAVSGLFLVKLGTKTTVAWWTWLVCIEPEWAQRPARDVQAPFLVGFFTCIGLNASWALARRGSVQVLTFLVCAAVLAVIQNALGVGLAKLLGVSPLLGLVCGSATMTGGHGTVLGFAGEFVKAGLPNAAVVGVAAATFGLVAGGLLGGPVGGGLVRKFSLRGSTPASTAVSGEALVSTGILEDFRALARFGRAALLHLLLVLLVIKAGAWASHGIQALKLTFPVYMGAMILGVLLRNALDLLRPGLVRTEVIEVLAALALGFFLAIAMMSLNLIELANAALPMLVILSAQVVVMAAFAWFVTFRVMGRDYDAAVMVGGHCGFGLGATPNAVANMQSLVRRFGPAPRAYLVVPLVGAFLIDFFNALNITAWLNFAR